MTCTQQAAKDLHSKKKAPTQADGPVVKQKQKTKTLFPANPSGRLALPNSRSVPVQRTGDLQKTVSGIPRPPTPARLSITFLVT